MDYKVAKNRKEYKDSAIGLIPSGWQLKRVSDITTFHKQGYYTKEIYNPNGKYFLLRGTDLLNQRIDFSTTPKIEASKKDYEQFKAERGDFLIVRSGAIGRYGIFDNYPPSIFGSYLIKFRFNKDILNKYFGLFYESSLCLNQLQTITQGSSNININAENIKSLFIPLPPIEEQKLIVKIIETWDTAIETFEKLIAKKERRKNALMQQLISGETRFKQFKSTKWEKVNLGGILELLTDFEANGSFADVKENVAVLDYPGFAWYVRATDLENKTELAQVKYVDKKSYAFLKKTTLHGDELLITKRGEIGKVYFFKKIDLPATVAPNMYLLKFKNKAIPKYFYYYFISTKGNNQLKRINASATIGALYKDDVKSIELQLPSLKEQNKISTLLSLADDEIETLNQQLNHHRKQKQELMNILLSGEVKVND